jgi:hypothetical protein
MSSTDLRGQVVAKAAAELESYLSKFADVLAMSKASKPLREAAETLRAEAAEVAEAAQAKPAPRVKPAPVPVFDAVAA